MERIFYRGTPLKHDLALAGLCLIVAILIALPFLNLFPLTEYRDWIRYNPFSWRHVLRAALVRKLLFSRDISLAYTSWSGTVCGNDIPCLNSLSLLPIVLTAPVLYGFSRTLRLRPIDSLLAVCVWLISCPVLDAMSWQATIHDRCAFLFALLSLWICIASLRCKPNTENVLGANLLIGSTLFLAYNSKESAFFLAPALILSVSILIAEGIKEKMRRCAMLVLPLLYAGYHNIRYAMAINADPGWLGHIANGSAIKNVPIFLKALSEGYWILWLAVVIFAASILCRRPLKNELAQHAGEVRTFLWISSVFVITLAIPIRAQFQSEYYLYAPKAFFAILLASSMALFTKTYIKENRRLRFALFAGLIMVSLTGAGKCFRHTYLPIVQSSENFIASFPQLKDRVREFRNIPVRFIAPAANPRAFRFFEGSDFNNLWRFVNPGANIQPGSNVPIVFIQGNDTKEVAKSGYDIQYDRALRLISIQYNGETRYEAH